MLSQVRFRLKLITSLLASICGVTSLTSPDRQWSPVRVLLGSARGLFYSNIRQFVASLSGLVATPDINRFCRSLNLRQSDQFPSGVAA